MAAHIYDRLSEMLGAVTGAESSAFTPHTQLMELPLESLGAVRLRARIDQTFGADLAMSEFYGERTIAQLVDAIRTNTTANTNANAGQAVGSSPSQLVTSSRAQEALPSEMPLTDVQSAYWVGRDAGMPLGGVATYWFNEYELDLTEAERHFTDVQTYLARLEGAWQRLVAHHPMLRVEVTSQGTQRVRDHLDWRLPHSDLRTHADAHVRAQQLREQHSHRILTNEPHLFFVYAIVLPDAIRVQVGFDAIAVDLASWQLLMGQWGELVADPSHELDEPPFTFFEHLTERERDPQRQRNATRDLTWWTQRAATLPSAPKLPLRSEVEQPSVTSDNKPTDVAHRFTRHGARLDAPTWKRIQHHARKRGLTSSTVALAVFSLMLERHTGSSGMTLSATLSQRPERDGAQLVVGDFAQTGLLAVADSRRSEGVTFARHAEAVRESFFDTVGHADVSSLAVTRAMGAGAGAYPVVFTSGLGVAVPPWDHWLGRRVFGVSQTPQVLLDHLVWEEAGELVLTLDSVDDHLADGFTDGLMTAMMQLYRTLDDAQAWQDVRLGWDPSGQLPQPPAPDPFGAGPLLHDPLWAQVQRISDSATASDSSNALEQQVAVRCGDAELTFKALGQRAQVVAGHVAGVGVRTGEPVLVIGAKSCGQIVAVTGVMRSGAAYIPVDPAWPQSRVESVIAKSGARLAVTIGAVTVPQQVVQIVCDEHGQVVSAPSDGGRGVAPTANASPSPEDLAYAIFTSGSTGTPKGVAETHAQARTTLNDVVTRFNLTANDAVLGVSALSFDLSVFDIFGVLGVGAKLVLPDAMALRDPAAWCALIERENITVWNSAPALLEMLVEYAEHDANAARQLASLRLVMLSGDWIPVTLPNRLRALVAGVSFNSLGGATEASIWSITYPVGEVDPNWPSIPYGRALAGQSFYILNDDLDPVAAGDSGELFIGGDGVASGYLADPEQTSERFITHPVLGERLYRTGDLGRWRRDGNIEFMGRVDRQVKVGGFRIELGEVESALTRCRNVRQAVAASVAGPDGRPRLVAWVAGRDLTVAGMRRELAEHLPPYMIPSRFDLMEALPVTENGKVDYKGLVNPFKTSTQSDETPAIPADVNARVPDDSVAAASPAQDVAPETPAAELVATHPSAWACVAEILQRQPDASATLLGQGATSLELIRVANALEERFGVRPDVSHMMQQPLQQWMVEWTSTLAGEQVIQGAHADEGTTTPPELGGASDPVSSRAPIAGATPNAELGFPVPPTSAQLTLARPSTPDADDLVALGQWLKQVQAWAETNDRTVGAAWADGDELLTLTLGDAAAVTADDGATQPEAVVEVAEGVADAVTPFALTEMQLAYLVGRADDWLGTPVGPHYYTEAEFLHLDVARLQHALDALVRRHPMLRARASADARQYVLAADDPSARVMVRHHDFTALTDEVAQAALMRVRDELSRRVVDPLNEPGLDVRVSTLPTGVAVLHFGLDLLFVDAASAVTVVDELRALYEGRTLSDVTSSFVDWISHSYGDHGSRREQARAYFAAQADHLPAAPKLPVAPPTQVRVRRHEQRLATHLWQGVQAQARAHHVTPIGTLLTALGAVLAPVSGPRGCSVVTTVFNRPDDQRGVVGDYTSTLLTALPQPSAAFRQQAQTVSSHVLTGLEHALGAHGVHGNEVMRMVAAAGGSRRFPVAFSSGLGSTFGPDGAARDAGRLLDGWGRTTYAISQTPHVVIDVQTFEADGELVLRWDAIDDALPDGWVDAAFGAYTTLVESLAQEQAWQERPQTPWLPSRACDPRNAEPTDQAAALVRADADHLTIGRPLQASADPQLAQQLRQLLAQQLGVSLDASDEDTSFFELGTSSVDLVAWHGVLTAQGFDLSVVDLFAHPTLTRLASLLTDEPTPTDELKQAGESKATDDPHAGTVDLMRSHAVWESVPRWQERRGGESAVRHEQSEPGRASRAARRAHARAQMRNGEW